jgi:hypothetical protein
MDWEGEVEEEEEEEEEGEEKKNVRRDHGCCFNRWF